MSVVVDCVCRGLTLHSLMSFLTRGPLRHSSGEVRDKAEPLIISLYEDVGAPVRQYLSNADENTRKSLLYKQLFKAFDQCDASRGGREVIGITADDDNNNVRHGNTVNKKRDTLGNKRDNKVCVKHSHSLSMISCAYIGSLLVISFTLANKVCLFICLFIHSLC